MTLYEKLQQSKSEEDVKDVYIKALGLKIILKIFMTYKPKKSGLRLKMVTSTALIKCLPNCCITYSRH